MGLFKKGVIVINPKNEDKVAAIHPLLHIDKGHAAIITHNPPATVKKIELDESDVYGLKMSKKQSYVTDEIVYNTGGIKIGGIKSSFFPKLNKLADNFKNSDFKIE